MIFLTNHHGTISGEQLIPGEQLLGLPEIFGRTSNMRNRSCSHPILAIALQLSVHRVYLCLWGGKWAKLDQTRCVHQACCCASKYSLVRVLVVTTLVQLQD